MAPKPRKQIKLPKKKPAPKKTASAAKSEHFSSLLTSSLESVEAGVLIVDLTGKIVFYNSKFLELWRIPATITKSRNDAKTLQFVATQIKDFQSFIERVTYLYQHPKEAGNDHIELKDDRVLSRFTRPHVMGKKIVGRVWSFTDITPTIRKEHELKSLITKHDLIVASFGRVVYDYDISSGKILWSGNIQAVLGYTENDMGDLGRWETNVHPEDRDAAINKLQVAILSGSRFEATYRYLTQSKGYVWIRDKGFLIADAEGKSVRMLGEMVDISDQMKAEMEIRHLASFPLHNPEIVFEINHEGKLTFGNPAFYEAVRRLGLTSHEAFVTPEAAMQPMEATAWKNTAEVVIKGRTFNEKIFYLPEKRLMRIYAFDLTERLEFERQKSDLEITYKALFDGAIDAIIIVDIEENPGKILSANASAAQMYGYSISEFLTKTIPLLDVITDFAPYTFEERVEKLQIVGKQVFEVVHRKKDGSEFPLEVMASIFEVSGKKYMLGIERDITQRKKDEEEIKLQYRFIETLASSSPNLVYVYDFEKNRNVYANKVLAQEYGISIEEANTLTLDKLAAFLHPEDAKKFDELNTRWLTAKDGEVFEGQFRLVKPDGSIRIFKTRETVFHRNLEGQVVQFMGTAYDRTSQIEAEKALKESEVRFRALHQASFGGIAIHDLGNIQECNSGLSDLTGYSYEELIGSDGLLLIHPEDRALAQEHIKNSYEVPYKVRGLKKDGTVYPLEVRGKAAPYKGKTMRITEFRDITEWVEAEEKMLEQNARLQAIAEDLKFKNAQLDEFTQIVSHNLRSPAGNIVALADFLNAPQDEIEREQTLKLLKQSGVGILTTLHELNEVLKIKQNKNLEKQHLTFQDAFQNATTTLAAHIANNKAEISGNFKRAPFIEYPKIYLESIFLNLLSNAIKYRHPQRPPIISFTTYLMDGKVVLVVSDNGLGIDMERHGHQIFKMRKTFHHHPDSRGIGLFMVKNQIEAMGGQITLISQVNSGTQFRVIF